jgi:hypothetical protein
MAGRHFGLEALLHAVLDFGTQAWLSVPRLLVVWLYRQSLFKKIVLSYLSAISMPIDLYRGNRLIVKRIINKLNFNENNGSDTSCYRETKIW